MQPVTGFTPGSTDLSRPDPLLRKAQDLETAFLAEMLGYAGLEGEVGSFGGGAGEEQFASFLREEQARLMVEQGGIGLAETLFRAMGGEGDGR